ncbi:hypothetical protein D5S17_04405 [Pseudonocardiaceae bacterium YIM PH 21723]|nr:hypothetical protein D5S17_04405 [Pseudonocardiaceae bacterium YIM PH 21723]
MPESEHTLSTADLAGTTPQEPEAPVEREESADRPETSVRREEPTGQPLFSEGELDRFRGRWQDIQTGFVDDPHRAVQEADELVANVINTLATTFAEHKGVLEDQWRQGEPATEELRVALRRYRAFFDELLPR